MKLALVSVDTEEALPPLGLGYLASYLREYANFYDTIIVDKEDQLKRIRKEKPDVVGISATTLDFTKAVDIAQEVKESMGVPTLIGGFHVTALPHLMPECFDVGVLGEGENTIVELVNAFEKKGSFEADDLKQIKGIAFREKQRVRITPPREIIQPLDSIPFPARDLMKIKEYYLKPARHTFDKLSVGTSLITTRGCPFKCRFCSQTGFWHHSYRFFSPEYVVNEMSLLLDSYKLDMIRVMDDLFVANKKRIKKIVELMKKEKLNERAEFHVFGRTSLMDDEMACLLKGMNTKYVNFGFESGSEKVLNYLKKGSATLADHNRALKACRKHGLKVDGSFIFGSPNETKEDIKKTLEFVKNPTIRSVMFFKLSPLPHSELWDEALKEGLVSENMDWNLLKAEFNPDYPFLGKEMTKKEFFEMVPIITKAYCEKQSSMGLLKFKWSYLFNPKLIKRFLSHWRGYSKEFLLKFRKQLNIWFGEKTPESREEVAFHAE